MSTLIERYETAPLTCLIGGQWSVCEGVAFERTDPTTGEARAPLRLATAGDVEEAVTAAAAAQADWGATPRAERFAYLRRLAALLERDADALALLISHEIGAPLAFARTQQVGGALAHLAAFLDHAETPEDVAVAGASHRVRYEPHGVAALITPWNWPLNQVVLKLGAALAAGCACVLKPSELTPLTALHLGHLCVEAGLPAGVVNIVPGGAEIGAALTRDARVDVISFTGSTRAGRQVAVEAGLRRTILELGGKSPNLLFADCDLETAIAQGVAHCFRNGGQSCNAASWMLVERGIYEAAVTKAAQVARTYGLGRTHEIGPVISAAQFERMQRLIGTGLREGARCVAGGLGADRAQGYYPRPTVLADVPPGSTVAQTELFGPVLAITPFADEAEAIALANSTPYGLSAYVQTADAARADRVSQALRAGMVQVNGTSRAPGAPFGGIRDSGQGREAGLWGIRAFQYVKSISGAAPQS